MALWATSGQAPALLSVISKTEMITPPPNPQPHSFEAKPLKSLVLFLQLPVNVSSEEKQILSKSRAYGDYF